jgi:hypothetical protein
MVRAPCDVYRSARQAHRVLGHTRADLLKAQHSHCLQPKAVRLSPQRPFSTYHCKLQTMHRQTPKTNALGKHLGEHPGEHPRQTFRRTTRQSRAQPSLQSHKVPRRTAQHSIRAVRHLPGAVSTTITPDPCHATGERQRCVMHSQQAWGP